MAGLGARRNAGARVQVTDDPQAERHEHHDDQSRSHVLPHAAAVLFTLDLPQRIEDPALPQAQRQPFTRERNDFRAPGGDAWVLDSRFCAVLHLSPAPKGLMHAPSPPARSYSAAAFGTAGSSSGSGLEVSEPR